MAEQRDSDGVVEKREPGWLLSRALLGFALVAILIAVGVFTFMPSRPAAEEPSAAAPVQAEAAPEQPHRNAPSRPPADPLERAVLKAIAAADAGVQEPEPEQQEIRVEQLPPGDGGIFAFPKPGTKPIKVGLIVPDGFELPPGYVRHYQTTDDGRQLPPILMFHPDYKPVDAQGNPIELPADGIVPPELAPRGMQQEWLEPPPPPGAKK